MQVGPGTDLGAYHVVELLGAGGMGEVYLAQDTRLGRDVALKVLRPSFAADPDRLARFEREARLLASLSHPHIAAIHGVEEHDGVRFLVLELVRGETLAERLADRALPVPEALALAVQISSAIEAAHERGIIHRDLKPGNIKITPAGDVKLLDFGIAKALGDTGASGTEQFPTLTSGGTREGTIVGTAAYMSPEQARGKPVDKRTDVWSFGCVLFDMLTGRAAFAGDTLSDVIAAILTRGPDWSLLPADTPAPIRQLLARCLEKDLPRRLHDIGDVRIEIEDAIARPSGPNAQGTAALARGPAVTSRPRALTLAAAGVGGALLGAGVLWMLGPQATQAPRPPIQFTVPLQGNERLAAVDFRALDVSPQDTAIAYVASTGGESRIVVRPLSALTATPLPGTEGALGPFFSPDGQWIAFFAAGKLKKVPVAGGPVKTLADAPIGFGGAWAEDNTIVYAPNNGSALWQVSADGGAPRAITELDTARGEFSHRWPEVLPGGRTILFTAAAEGSWDDAEIVVQTIGSRDRRTLVHGGTSPRYLEPGRLLYARGGSVFALPLDLRSLRVSGDPSPGAHGIMESLDGAAEFVVSRAGSLVYAPGGSDPTARTLAWVDRRGNVEPLAAPARAYADPRVSPDGRRIAITVRGQRDDVWTYDIASNTLTQLTFDGGGAPTWSADGERVAFSASHGGPSNLFQTRVDGGAAQRLTSDARRQVPASASPDGSLLAFIQWDDASGRDVEFWSEGDRMARPYLTSPANESSPSFSPDGRLVAYCSDVSGAEEVYVAPASDASRSVRVSVGGGSEPVWQREGSELFFRSGSHVLAAAIGTAGRLSAGTPRVLFEGAFESGGGARPGYDVSVDGSRLLMIRPADAERTGRQLRVFINWHGAAVHDTPTPLAH
jgi:serine/threonine-protein kinase